MIRIFVFLLIVLSLGFGFSWIAEHPGVVTLNWQGKDIRTSLMVVVIAIVVFVAVLMITWGILRDVVGFPTFLSRFLTNRRRDRGYDALSKGLIAAGTGDKVLARRLTKESGKLLSNEPLVDLLEAQTSLLENNREAARGRFQAMLENDETKLLGLRGLYLEAEREGVRDATRQYAEQASELAPSLAWAGDAKLRSQTMDGDWEAALGTLESNRSAGLLDKDQAKRHRAVLLTARAISEEPANPDLSAKLAKEAHRLSPDLVPAAVIGATAYARGNNLRKASKLIEATWNKNPHPELADAYIHLRMGDSASDRLQRAQSLAKMRTNHPEGNMAIAEAAIDAKEWTIARDAMKPVLVNNLSERACLIMADMEEGEHGDAGRMRDWLSRAVRAPKDAKWTSDGYTSETWLPVSPTTGEIDVFEWKVPVGQLQESGTTIEIGDLAEPLKIIPAKVTLSGDENTGDNNSTDGSLKVATSVAAAAGMIVANSDDDDNEKDQVEQEKEDEVEIIEASSSVSEPEADKKEKLNEANGVETEAVAAEDIDRKKDSEPTNTVFPLKHRPDDPGVSDSKQEDSKFKLF